MAHVNNKLELNWIGKYDEKKPIEPRILVENPDYSYGDTETGQLTNGKTWNGNMIIHGDNLLSLQALIHEYANSVKCIYIDPPYNTGSAFDYYDDSLEHSIWLSLMRDRLLLLKQLLASDGSIWIQIDDNEVGYLITLCDEIFGRKNRVNIISVKMSETSGVKMAHVDKRLPKLKEFILVYKNENFCITPIKVAKTDNLDDYLKYYSSIITNYSAPCEQWIICKVEEAMAKDGIAITKESIRKYKLDNAMRMVYRTNNKSFEKYNFDDGCKIHEIISSKGLRYIWWEGKQMLFLSDYITEYLGDLWLDISTINLNKEGAVDFANSKKPEKLIERIFTLTTKEGDLVLDSFLGSGTTAAVAHKMHRKYIGVEIGDHAYTHCVERLKLVCDGKENGGITKSVNWKGGGGFKFYELAPSLLKKDTYGNLVINKEYNADMLAAAMAKLQGFVYEPSTEVFWKQGHSSENDFIYTTTQFMTAENMAAIEETMGEDESLLICCKAFQHECKSASKRITVKKIPAVLLDKCEFDHDDYSLNVVELPELNDEDAESENQNTDANYKETLF